MGVDRIHQRRLQSRNRSPAAIVVPCSLGPDRPARLADCLLRPVQNPKGLLLAGDRKGGNVVVHHRNAELGGNGQPLLLQQRGKLARRVSRPLAAGQDHVDILARIPCQLQLLQKKAENAGQSLEIYRRNKAHTLLPANVIAVAAAAHRVPQKDQPVVRSGGDALGCVPAVAGGGKIKYHANNSF